MDITLTISWWMWPSGLVAVGILLMIYISSKSSGGFLDITPLFGMGAMLLCWMLAIGIIVGHCAR